MLVATSLVLLAATARAAQLTLQSPRFSVIAPTGDPLRSEPLSLANKVAIPVELEAKDKLKLSFQVVDKDSGNGVQPHQTFLRFYDAETGEEGIQPIRVTSSGKAKFELNMAKPPPGLPASGSAPLQVSLILGSSSHSPLNVALFDLKIPASQPLVPHPEASSFHAQPIIEHTFREAEKLPPRPISALFAGLVLAPWVVLLGMWAAISPRVPRLFSPSIVPFTLTLASFEVLLFWYWVDLRLGDVLFYGAGLAIITFFTGKHALGSIASHRTGK